MKLIRDPFLGRLLMALALYATIVVLWTHSPAPPAAAAAMSGGIGQVSGPLRPSR